MRMTKSERRRYIRHRKRMERMALRAAEKKEKVSGQFMNRVVIAMILAAFIFTVVMIFVFVRTGSEPSTLIENVFRFLSVEGGAMALIKSVKTVTKKRSDKESENQQSFSIHCPTVPKWKELIPSPSSLVSIPFYHSYVFPFSVFTSIV